MRKYYAQQIRCLSFASKISIYYAWNILTARAKDPKIFFKKISGFHPWIDEINRQSDHCNRIANRQTRAKITLLVRRNVRMLQ